MALEVEEVLSLWREGERLLDELPAESPDRTVVSAEVVALKGLYRRVTDESDVSAHILDASHRMIADARRTLAEARTRIDRP